MVGVLSVNRAQRNPFVDRLETVPQWPSRSVTQGGASLTTADRQVQEKSPRNWRVFRVFSKRRPLGKPSFRNRTELRAGHDGHMSSDGVNRPSRARFGKRGEHSCRCEFVSFGEGLQPPPFGCFVRRGSPDPAVRLTGGSPLRSARVSRPRRSAVSFGEGLQTPPFGCFVRRGSPDPAVRLFRSARVSRPRRSAVSFGEGLQTPPFG